MVEENCTLVNGQPQEYGPAILVPEIQDFIPPFQLITRGEFLAVGGQLQRGW
jgi:hypothetical protein